MNKPVVVTVLREGIAKVDVLGLITFQVEYEFDYTRFYITLPETVHIHDDLANIIKDILFQKTKHEGFIYRKDIFDCRARDIKRY